MTTQPSITINPKLSVSLSKMKLNKSENKGLAPIKAATTETLPAERAENMLNQPILIIIPEKIKYLMLLLLG
jgi:hypothetical protein